MSELTVHTDQIAGQTNNAFLTTDSVHILCPAPPDARQRQEGCTAKTILLQKLYHTLCRLFIIRNNIGNTAAKGCLYGNFIFFADMDNIRHNANDTFIVTLTLHDLTNADTVTVIALRDILQCLITC